MTRPLPELVTKSRNRWDITPPTHDPHTTTAHPKARRASGDIERTDSIAHATRLLGLVAARYNTRRPDRLAKIVKDHTARTDAQYLLSAAQEVRNRYLAQRARPDLPQPRYHLPEQLATHHANTARPNLALDLATLLHHPNDLATYLAALRRLGATELADTAEATATEITQRLDDLARQLTDSPRSLNTYTERYEQDAEGNYNPILLRANVAETAALNIATMLAAADDRMGTARGNDNKNRHKRQREADAKRRQQKRQAETGTTIPGDANLHGWYAVIPHKPPRDIAHTGRLGRRRIATNAGKNPTRIHNYYADPARRIFTRKTRGTNALVIVDASGSMSLSTDDLDQIMTASAGATVIAYSSSGDSDPNTHLLAHDSRRVRDLPRFAGGNGIDAPAVLWAIKNYRKKNAPVLWVTDGGATGIGDHSNAQLRAQCVRLAQQHGITIAGNVKTALADLDLIRAGKRPPQRLGTFTK